MRKGLVKDYEYDDCGNDHKEYSGYCPSKYHSCFGHTSASVASAQGSFA
jgi:hypothetical protein